MRCGMRIAWIFGMISERGRSAAKKKVRRIPDSESSGLFNCAINEPKPVLAQGLGNCRDNERNPRSVFRLVVEHLSMCFRAWCSTTEHPLGGGVPSRVDLLRISDIAYKSRNPDGLSSGFLLVI